MRLKEISTPLLKEAVQYQIAGPIKGDKLPLSGGPTDSVETWIDLQDKRIDIDNDMGIIIRPKFTESEQTQFITKNLKPGMPFKVVQPNGEAIIYYTIQVAGNTVIGTQDPNNENPVQVKIPGNRYYIDIDNTDNLISFENERSRAEKFQLVNRLGKGTTVTVI